ncbi:MAG: type I-C CRISPR-associated protein Cas5 [Bacteroidales bacterium]|nr:type I-C CRISPR-associated protein Cas5 [Bacteroidales bacterium]
MEYYDKEFCLEVWGPMACFTRPELKVERVSYDVITPSAARAIFEAIFWKPAIHWQVTKIEVLNNIQWMSVRRNEVGAVAGKSLIYIEDKRQQKNTLMLRDVRYRIWAKLCFIPMRERIKGNQSKYQRWFNEKEDQYVESKNPMIDAVENDLLRKDENPGKYNAMFERRASKGQCFTQPYLGTRECTASFRLVNPETETLVVPISEDRDLGIMLYDMDFEADLKNPPAMFYRAKMEDGVIIIPPKDSEEILR